MTSIRAFLAADHERCDLLFAEAEAAAGRGDLEQAAARFTPFRGALLHHFTMEEEVMFPAFEARTGMVMGPTQVMRSEHGQMKGLLDQMADALRRGDAEAFLGDADTLLVIMQQHNVKEEQMLYPMADQALAGELEDVVGRMRAME